MGTFWLAALVALVATLVASPIVRRLRPSWAEPLWLARTLLVSAILLVAFASAAIAAAREGGALFLGLAVILALLAVWAVVRAAIYVWAYSRRGDEVE